MILMCVLKLCVPEVQAAPDLALEVGVLEGVLASLAEVNAIASVSVPCVYVCPCVCGHM